MIEKMQMVHVVTSVSRKQEMLDGLRSLGAVHLAEKKSADRKLTERFSELSKTAMALKDYAPDKAAGSKEILSDAEFESMYEKVFAAINRRSELIQEMGAAKTELERIQPWGDFSPSDIKDLKNSGIDLHFYRMGKNEYEAAVKEEGIQIIRLASVDKMNTVAVLGTLPASIPANEFALPEKGAEEIRQEFSQFEKEIADCEAVLRDASQYEESFNVQLLKTQNEENYSAADATAQEDQNFVWISGYIPEADLGSFKQMAAEKKWAWAVDEVADEDEKVPTKVRYNKVSGLIKPVFDILGILPGYREQDVSIWFLMFFALFFAMIIGDGGYGVLILVGTLAFAAKTKKRNDAVYLLLILSVTTIIWGAVTGTWFGMESAMKVPFLKALVIPNFANYPQYFNVSATAQQNTIMKFSFAIGAIQMALGSLLAVKKKIKEKNLSWVADLGWMVSVISMYFLALSLVIGENIPMQPIFVGIGVAFVVVIIFGGMSPDKTFAQGLKAGAADAFTVFLNTISCFGNVMSYIRLFAVGMAGLAISQSFNGIAAGFKGPLVIAGVIVVIVGHALNIVMCFLSVVVHGVRLNVLEFSGQAGLEWAGIAYEPFKKNEKLIK